MPRALSSVSKHVMKVSLFNALSRVTQPSWKINLEKVGIMNRRTYLMGNFYAIHDMEECSRQVFTIVVARYSEETD